jgi:hypothetical protein
VPAASSFSLNVSKLPKVDLMSSAILPVGCPPAFGPMMRQNREWLACPPPLLRTTPRMSSGIAFMLLINSSIDFFSRSALPAMALFKLVT